MSGCHPSEVYEIKTAWECPRCGRMNAPHNPVCFCSREGMPYTESIPYTAHINRRCFNCNLIHPESMGCISLNNITGSY